MISQPFNSSFYKAYALFIRMRKQGIYAAFFYTAFIAASLLVAGTITAQAKQDFKHAKTQPGPAAEAKFSYGYSPLHSLKYGADFTHFSYVNPNAPKGGAMRLGRRGTFNSLNLLKYPGKTPLGRNELPINLVHYLYDSLLAKSADEIAGYYGLLAESFSVDPRLSWIKFKINPKAKWHDGTPITADDVLFTVETIKKQGLPYYRQVLRRVKVTKQGSHEITFHASRPGNRDFIEVVGLMPVHPKHYWAKHDVTKTTLTPPLAGGPYRILKTDVGRSVTFARAKSYWGRDLPVNKGRYNFDEIVLQFYRSNISAIEAFKSGDVDMRLERDAVAWATGYKGIAFQSGKIEKLSLGHKAPGRFVSLVFNLRRPVFSDRRVRKAIALAYDFERVNFTLFHKFYKHESSYFGKTELGAKGPAGEGERKLLSAYLEDLPKGMLEKAAPPWRIMSEGQVYNRRKALGEAARLLDQAGYPLKGQYRINPKTGEPLKFNVAYINPRFQRVLSHYSSNLKQLGIQLVYPSLEPISASKKVLEHDYDMTFLTLEPKMKAGTSEHLLWHSRLADAKRSYALAGAKDKALDHMIISMLRARNWQELTYAAKAYDRVLQWRIYHVPLWHSAQWWLAKWKKFGRPARQPDYEMSFVDRWWGL